MASFPTAKERKQKSAYEIIYEKFGKNTKILFFPPPSHPLLLPHRLQPSQHVLVDVLVVAVSLFNFADDGGVVMERECS